ncbi:hypothetical protein MHBO_004552 [Bonamia ostreae]|uniref:Uncharacterized protein n=1 Tax=Bonamia ostreae TaxID=126728 RepID=A0ABV2AUE2_9EUKA
MFFAKNRRFRPNGLNLENRNLANIENRRRSLVKNENRFGNFGQTLGPSFRRERRFFNQNYDSANRRNGDYGFSRGPAKRFTGGYSPRFRTQRIVESKYGGTATEVESKNEDFGYF